MANRRINRVPIDGKKLTSAIYASGYSIIDIAKLVDRSDRSIRAYIKEGAMPSELLENIRRLTGYKNSAEITDNWEKLWIAPSDGTFKGRCRECGFTHLFIDGHCSQYRYCPQCGAKKFSEVAE